jgi:hypothetical protein
LLRVALKADKMVVCLVELTADMMVARSVAAMEILKVEKKV